jgi:hypothetical protein
MKESAFFVTFPTYLHRGTDMSIGVPMRKKLQSQGVRQDIEENVLNEMSNWTRSSWNLPLLKSLRSRHVGKFQPDKPVVELVSSNAHGHASKNSSRIQIFRNIDRSR